MSTKKTGHILSSTKTIHIDADNCDALLRDKILTRINTHNTSLGDKSKVSTDNSLIQVQLYANHPLKIPPALSKTPTTTTANTTASTSATTNSPTNPPANTPTNPPATTTATANIHIHIVAQSDQSADEAIIAAAQAHDLVITRDLVLAKLALQAGAYVCSDQGESYSLATIDARITRAKAVASLRAQDRSASNATATSKTTKSLKQAQAKKKKQAYREQALQYLDSWIKKSST